MRQVVADLTSAVLSGRDGITRFSVRSYHDAFPRFLANNGRFNLSRDRDFYSDVLLAAAMPDDDFPAFATATAILLIDLLQNGDGSDDLYWNWDSFQEHYRLADPSIRAALMNAFRLGSEIGAVKIQTPPNATDCLTLERDKVISGLANAQLGELKRVLELDASAYSAGQLWQENAGALDPRAMPAFRYLYERPISLTPAQQEATPLIPWS